MRSLFPVSVALFCLMSSDIALAITGSNCPSLQNQRNPQLPVVSPINQPTYMCSNATNGTDPPRLGDLSAQGQMENTQICDSNCDYRPLFPEDPDSPLVPINCGRTQQLNKPYAINGNAVSQGANQGPAPPYMGTGGNCMPLMIPQAPINLEDQKPPAVNVTKPKPSASPSPSPAPGGHG